MYAGSSGFSHGQNKMYWGMGNGKWQGLPATRNMRTGPLLTHVRSQAYDPPEKRRKVFLFNALAGGVGKMRSVRRCDYRCASNSVSKPQLPNPSYATRSNVDVAASGFGFYDDIDVLTNWNAMNTANQENTGCPDDFTLDPDAYITYMSEDDIKQVLESIDGHGSTTTLSQPGTPSYTNVDFNYIIDTGPGIGVSCIVSVKAGESHIFYDNKKNKIYYQINIATATPQSLIQQVVSGLGLIKVSDGVC